MWRPKYKRNKLWPRKLHNETSVSFRALCSEKRREVVAIMKYTLAKSKDDRYSTVRCTEALHTLEWSLYLEQLVNEWLNTPMMCTVVTVVID